jgi:site-specific recombinase XerD
MSDRLGRFRRYLELERGYSSLTVDTYGRIAGDFLDFAASEKIKLRYLCREDLQRYVAYLRGERYNGSRSIRLKLQVVKSFLEFLSLEDGPAAVKLSLTPRDFSYKTECKEAESLSEAQLASLIEAAVESRDRARGELERATGKTTLKTKQLLGAQRDLALLALLIGTGVRIAEALAVGFFDIDFTDKTILIHGKGKKLRKVFFDLDGLSEHLLPYIEMRRTLETDHEHLFVEIKSLAPLHSRGFQKRLKSHLHNAGLRTSITPHTLRHSFATVAIEKGANIKAVSQILGHANCKITIDLYTHLSSEHLREVMQRCNPLSKEVIPIEERIEMRKRHLPYLERTG